MSSEIALVESASLVAPPPTAPSPPRSQVIAAALLAGASAMGILGLIGVYLSARHGQIAGNIDWIPTGGLSLTGPNIALFTLLISIPTMAWAQYSLAKDDRQNLWFALGIILVLGIAFINAESFILTNMNLSTEIDKTVGIAQNLPTLLIFIIVGAHLVMVGAALISVFLTGLRTLGGQLNSRDRDGLNAVALYWYATVAVFVVLWYAIYVTK